MEKTSFRSFTAWRIVIRSLLYGVFMISFQGVLLESVQAEALKIGFIYVGPANDAGWNYGHEQGRQVIAKLPGIETKYVESVPAGAVAETTLRQLAEEQYRVIFATSFDHMNAVINVAKEFPDTIFMHCSGYLRAENVGTYYARYYQAYYLTGMIAGGMTRTNTLGCVAPYPIPGIIRLINAIALGAQKVNPTVRFHVQWTNNWFDPPKEKELAIQLVDAGADVLVQLQDSPMTQIVAKERGVYAVGYPEMGQHAPEAYLTGLVWNWNAIYEYVIEQVQAGEWKSEDIWWGMDKNAVKIAPFGSMVPEELQQRTLLEQNELIQGRDRIFEGPITDQQGNVRISPGQKATDEELLNMDWLVEGVVGTIE